MAIEFTLEELQEKVNVAVKAYTAWLQGSKYDHARTKMASGFFCWARHGSYGLIAAQKLQEAITTAVNTNDAGPAISALSELMEREYWRDSFDGYVPRHSLASFLLDELKSLNGAEGIYATQECENKRHRDKYDQLDCKAFKKQLASATVITAATPTVAVSVATL